MARQRKPLTPSIVKSTKAQAEIEWIKVKLDKAEKSGFTTDSKAQILSDAKQSFK